MRIWFKTAKEDGCRWYITDKNGNRVFQYLAICRIDDRQSSAVLLEFTFLRWLLVIGYNKKVKDKS